MQVNNSEILDRHSLLLTFATMVITFFFCAKNEGGKGSISNFQQDTYIVIQHGKTLAILQLQHDHTDSQEPLTCQFQGQYSGIGRVWGPHP